MAGTFKDHGIGVGLRGPHVAHLLKHKPITIQWLEVISENYMHWQNGLGGTNQKRLLKFREHWPIAMHGVSMSLGSVDPINLDYLKRLKVLAQKVQPMWISDHICWTGVDGVNLHDLFPLPYTEEALVQISKKINQVQDYLEQKIVVENVSSYVTYKSSEMKEWDFVAEIARRTGCGILLDVNNIYVSAQNHKFDPLEYLMHMPKKNIAQMHLAGHTERDGVLIDTHSAPIRKEVWDLYEIANKLFPNVSTMIERDEDIPAWPELEKELIYLNLLRSGGQIEAENHTARI